MERCQIYDRIVIAQERMTRSQIPEISIEKTKFVAMAATVVS